MADEVLGKDLDLKRKITVSEVGFTSGTNKPLEGDKLTNGTDPDWIVVEVTVDTGSFDTDDAAGTLTLRKRGDDTLGWSDTDTITRDRDGSTIATVDGAPTDSVDYQALVEGVNSYTFNKDYTDTDTTTNDEDGNAASLPTLIDKTIDIELKRLEDDYGRLPTGQDLLKEDADRTGPQAVAQYDFIRTVSGASASYEGWIEFDTPLDSTHEDHVTATATFHINKKLS